MMKSSNQAECQCTDLPTESKPRYNKRGRPKMNGPKPKPPRIELVMHEVRRPRILTEAELRPWRELAMAVIEQAVQDLDLEYLQPLTLKNTFKRNAKIDNWVSAYTLLISHTELTNVWFELAGIEVEIVTRELKRTVLKDVLARIPELATWIPASAGADYTP